MAKGDTKTNQYLDIAANGTRADLPTDTCCETRTQTLIRGVAERIMDVEDEVEEIKNNPDVVDIVPTYAALQNYDTSGLTDKDIIRVLSDETHDGDSTYYRYNAQSGTWTYVGESKQYEDFVGTDGTAGGQNGLVPAPVATDAGKFLNANGSWEEVQAGGITELTSADYNYPTDNPTKIAAWLLDEGFYRSSVPVYVNSSTVKFGFFIVYSNATNTNTYVINYAVGSGTATMYEYSNGLMTHSYELKAPTVVQSTGTSTTDVMSQNATTSMVYADPGTNSKIKIGSSTNSPGANAIQIGKDTGSYAENALAIGYRANALNAGSVAIGRGANAPGIGQIALGTMSGSNDTTQGVMNIGPTNTYYGYNSSKYRLLTGLYDPQSAHDATNKEYVDPTTDSSAPTTATVGRLGQIQIDTTTATAYMCVAVDTVTPAYTWKQITA